ncbi:DNA-binding transcriptional MerR regulator [Saccharothrix tamanrassetensis]|uniref:DNA-binding transcriptional MerR regulator n=1 Tax=Saccharothrix tamanrassetensis TaxID=1051531 RepID=A0A841CQS7_9PSEU|nr:DNA-binding transcriptional MerR regulator [Saccharothrix tamanrassetensis]
MLAQLRSEFPDVTISKIRFLESEGLVRPARTASGYRQFTSADVERLRYVLAAQRDRYLPLKVIREQLDAADAGVPVRALRAVDGASPGVAGGASGSGSASAAGVGAAGVGAAGAAGSGPGMPAAEQFGGPVHRMTRDELLVRTGLEPSVLAELEQNGLIRAGVYDQDSVQVAATVRAMAEYGLDPRQLRGFRAAADREVGLVEQVVTPLYRQRDPRARGRADEAVRELAALSVTLHTLLVKAGLRDVAGNRVSPR